MIADMFARFLPFGGSGRAAAATTEHRRGSVDAAVAWWVGSMRGHDGVDPGALDAMADALSTDLVARLDTTYRVYLEVGHQPKGILRTLALASGLSLDVFPPSTTMAVSDMKVEVSNAAAAPYELVHTA
jgi:hypothetical protein